MKLRSRPVLHAPRGIFAGSIRTAPRVALGYAYGGGVTGPHHESMLALQRYELAKPEPLISHVLPQSGLYIEHNRNRIAEKFFADTNADWLLQIDSDIEFPPQLVEMLLAVAGSGKKVLAASVPLGPPLPSCAWMQTERPGIWAALAPEQIPEGGVECDGIATAVCLIHREVFEAIAAHEGQCWFLKLPAVPRLDEERSRAAWCSDGPPADRRYIPQGEDLSFCIRAKERGFSVWCARVPGLRHHKTIPLSHDFDAAELPEAMGQ